MKTNPIRGKTLRFTFHDGPMAGKTVEHVFDDDGGSVSWRVEGGEGGKTTRARKCEIAPVGVDVAAASYLADSGYTLTFVLDFRTNGFVAFSSNEKELGVQRGTFEDAEDDAPTAREGRAHHSKAPSVH